MKIGDKVICIKTCERSKDKIFEEGHIYKISHIHIDTINPDFNSCIVSRRKSFTLNIDNEDPEYKEYNFYTYFISLQEQRKLKLEKINGSKY